MKNVIDFRHILLLGMSLLLTACGGGDASNGTPQVQQAETPQKQEVTKPSLSGVAATGAPIGLAEVSITGVDASTKVVRTDIDGVYRIPLEEVKAPALLKVTMSDGRFLMSVWDGALKEESALTNITPLTDAIVSEFAKTIGSSGASLTPYDVAKNPNLLGSAKQKIQSIVEISMRKSGLDPASFDLMSSPFVANGKGIDAVLDSLTFERKANGEIQLYPRQLEVLAEVVKKEEIKPIAEPKPLTVNAPLTTVVVDDGLLNTAMLNAWRNKINSCMVVDVAKRSISSACVGIYPMGYKNDGVDFPANFYAETGEESTVGAVFETPSVLSITRGVDGLNAASVEIKWYQPKTRTAHSRLTVFKDLGGAGRLQDNRIASATGTSWWLWGNQSDYEIRIEPRVTRYENLNKSVESQAASPDSITYGLHVLINDKSKISGSWVDAGIRAAVVTGPGLPVRGLVLAPVDKRKFDSTYLGILNSSGALPEVGILAQSDVNEFRVAAEGLDKLPNAVVANWWSTQTQKIRNSEFSQVAADFSKFSPQSTYQIVLHFNNPSRQPTAFFTRLRGPLKQLKDVWVKWPEFQNKDVIAAQMMEGASGLNFGWKGDSDSLRIDSAFMSALAPKLKDCEQYQRWGASTLVQADLREQNVIFRPLSGNACLSNQYPASSEDSYVSLGVKALLNGVRYYSMIAWRP